MSGLQSEQALRVRGGGFGYLAFVLASERGDRAQHVDESRRLVAKSLRAGQGLVGRVGLEQQSLERHRLHERAQAARTLIGDGPTEAIADDELEQLPLLLRAA